MWMRNNRSTYDVARADELANVLQRLTRAVRQLPGFKS